MHKGGYTVGSDRQVSSDENGFRERVASGPAHRENCMYSGGRRGEKEGERERKTICGFYLTCDALGI